MDMFERKRSIQATGYDVLAENNTNIIMTGVSSGAKQSFSIYTIWKGAATVA